MPDCDQFPDQIPGQIPGAGALGAPFARMGGAEAARLAVALYGVSGRITRFATEKDDTFRILAGADGSADGPAYVLKIASPGEDAAELDMQVALLRHLEKAAPDLPVPAVFADRQGRDMPGIVDAAGQPRRVRLLRYLPGTVLDTTSADAGERARIGAMLARLRLAMAGFSHPAAGRAIAWDVTHLPRLAPLLAHVEDPAHRAVLAAGLARFEAVHPRLAGLRRQVLHNDFSRSNIVVDHDDPRFVTGIIDFGDAVETAVAVDVSTALMNQLPRDAETRADGDLLAEGRDLLRGYLEIADLAAEERALIPHLVMGRVVARALISTWLARRHPGNADYVLRNTAQGWAQLSWFLARDPETVSGLLA